MEDRVLKIAMLYLESTLKEALSTEEIDKIKKLVDMVKGDSPEEDLPAIKNIEDFYEVAKILDMDKRNLPKAIMYIFRNADKLNLPSELIGDIGEFLGEIKGIGFIPTSILERNFLRGDLHKRVKPNKWKFFFKDDKKLKKLKEQKGF